MIIIRGTPTKIYIPNFCMGLKLENVSKYFPNRDCHRGCHRDSDSSEDSGGVSEEDSLLLSPLSPPESLHLSTISFMYFLVSKTQFRFSPRVSSHWASYSHSSPLVSL